MLNLEAVGAAYKYWREEFSRAFAKFPGKFSLGRLPTRYNGEKIRHLEGDI